jgi:hypothetical protein
MNLKKMHEFHTLYSSPNIIQITKLGMMRRAGHPVRMGEMRKCVFFFVENSEVKQISSKRPRFDNNIKLDLKQIQCELEYLAMDRNKWQALPNMDSIGHFLD